MAPYPPMDSPATNVSSRADERRKNRWTTAGSSSVRNVQNGSPWTSSL